MTLPRVWCTFFLLPAVGCRGCTTKELESSEPSFESSSGEAGAQSTSFVLKTPCSSHGSVNCCRSPAWLNLHPDCTPALSAQGCSLSCLERCQPSIAFFLSQSCRVMQPSRPRRVQAASGLSGSQAVPVVFRKTGEADEAMPAMPSLLQKHTDPRPGWMHVSFWMGRVS